MDSIEETFKEEDFSEYGLSDFVSKMQDVFIFSDDFSEKLNEEKKQKNLSAIEFHGLWDNYFLHYMKWSGLFNRELRARIEESKNSDILSFQKYCYLYQYWWVLFHLLTKHFTNWNRDSIKRLEDTLRKKIKIIEERIKSDEIIDRFTKEDFDYLLNLEKMS